MQYAIAGWSIADCPFESLLERIIRELRGGWRCLISILNQSGVPKMDQTIMAIQTKFTIATSIGNEKMFREAVGVYKKWILILKPRSNKSIR